MRNKSAIFRNVRTVSRVTVLAAVFASTAAFAEEKFISVDPFARDGTRLELRADATVTDGLVRLRQIARWANVDRETFEPIGDLIVARFDDSQEDVPRTRLITVADLKRTLAEAGVNLARMNVSGSTVCTVTGPTLHTTRSTKNTGPVKFNATQVVYAAPELQVTDRDRSSSLSNRKETLSPVDTSPDQRTIIAARSSVEPAADVSVVPPADTVAGQLSLRQLLVNDLARRLDLPPDTLSLHFSAKDDPTLRMNEAMFNFDIKGQRANNLGDVSWTVAINTSAGPKSFFITANARAWQDQTVTLRPLAGKQLITAEDVETRRALVDRIGDDVPVKPDGVIGQLAARELKVGTVITGRLIDPVQLVRSGQYVTIENAAGAVSVRIVARALDGGSYGQSIRVKNETTNETLRVTVTGPQTATLNAV